MENSDLEYATKAARMLLHSYPNQPHDADTFLRQLTIACIGKPRMLLQTMVDPRYGFVADEKFLTIAALNEWFEKHNASHYAPPPEHRLLPPVQEPEVSSEEKERRIAMSLKVAEELKKVAKHNFVGRPEERDERTDARLRATQMNCGGRLLETDLMKTDLPAPHRNSA